MKINSELRTLIKGSCLLFVLFAVSVFLFIANMVSDPEALISNRKRNFTSLNDIIQDANNNEKIQVWIGPGTGSRDHLMAVKSWDTFGIDANWITKNMTTGR